jgi:hypothetical protein
MDPYYHNPAVPPGRLMGDISRQLTAEQVVEVRTEALNLALRSLGHRPGDNPERVTRTAATYERYLLEGEATE